MRKRRTRITDLFPEATEGYEEPSQTVPAVFVAAVSILSLVAIVAFIVL